MAEVTLYLVRHAHAGQRGTYPDDRLRPLVPKGKRQAALLERFLAAQDTRFDQLFSSPLTRAARTAEALGERLRSGRRIHYLDSLAAGNYPALLTEVLERLGPDDRLLGLVGHEPYLSELAAWLLSAQVQSPRLHLRKATFLTLSGEPAPGRMRLEALVPAAIYKRFAG